jgi:hypothetical protein
MINTPRKISVENPFPPTKIATIVIFTAMQSIIAAMIMIIVA